MADQDTIDGLLEGAIDTHIHSAPDVLPRKFNDLELAQRFKARRMAGFVLKSHYICTADRATLVNADRARDPGVRRDRAQQLRRRSESTGAGHRRAAGHQSRASCRRSTTPTSSKNVAGQRDESKLPYWMSIAREMRALGIAGSWLNVTEDGVVTPATRQCLEIIAKHDMVLATSHIRPSEVLPVVKAAREVGVKRIVITHPEFPTTLLEHPPAAGAGAAGRVFRALLHHAQYRQDRLGDRSTPTSARSAPRRTILATDLGQIERPVPRRGAGHVRREAPRQRLHRSRGAPMVRDNAAQLLGARDDRGRQQPPEASIRPSQH